MPSYPDSDCYATLGVDPSAPQEVIDAAWRALSKKFHPDLRANADAATGGSFGEEKQKGINRAYDCLKNPERRNAYDDWRRGQKPRAWRQPAPPQPRSSSPGSTLERFRCSRFWLVLAAAALGGGWLLAAGSGHHSRAPAATPSAAIPGGPQASPLSNPRASAVAAARARAPLTGTVLFPTGTVIEVLTVDQIAADVNRAGDVLRGSLAAPIVVAGRVAVPRGAAIYLRALAVRPAELRLALDHLGSPGHSWLLHSSSVDLAIPPGNPIRVSPGTALEFQLIGSAALPRGSRAK